MIIVFRKLLINRLNHIAFQEGSAVLHEIITQYFALSLN